MSKAREKFLMIARWNEFQHYSDRAPKWIKVYASVLESFDFQELSDAARSHLMLIWCLGSRNSGLVPYDAKVVAGKIGAKSRVDLEALVAKGFLIPSDGSELASRPLATPEQLASKLLAEMEQGASPEGELEGERDTTPSSRATTVLDRLVDPDHRESAARYLRSHSDPDSLVKSWTKLAEPISGNGFGWDVVGEALRQMRIKEKPYSEGLCAGYCKNIKAGPPPAKPRLEYPARGRRSAAKSNREHTREVLASMVRGGVDGQS